MFEIGNTLREARLRRSLDILQCEAETKIRAKYLRAMEGEHFDLMPSPTYVRGFLRTYAEFLDLDGQLVVDEYESRFGIYDPAPTDQARPWAGAPAVPDRPSGQLPRESARRSAPSGSSRMRKPPKRRRTELRLLWLAIGGVMGVALLVWMGAGSADQTAPIPGATVNGASAETGEARVADPDTSLAEAPARSPQARIVLSGVGGIGSWVQVRPGGPDGRIVFEGVLGPGMEREFRVRNPIHISTGNPAELVASVNGDEVPLEGATGRWLISADGAQSAD